MSKDWRTKALDKIVMEREANRVKNRNLVGWRKDAIGHSIYLPQSLWKRVRAAAAKEDVAIGGFMRRAILARTSAILGGGLEDDLPFVPTPVAWQTDWHPGNAMPPDSFGNFAACTHPGCDSEHLR